LIFKNPPLTFIAPQNFFFLFKNGGGGGKKLV